MNKMKATLRKRNPMTFLDFLIRKIESCEQLKPKRETKTMTIYLVRHKNKTAKIGIPKYGTRGFENNFKFAAQDVALLFNTQGTYDLFVLAGLILEMEEENGIKH